MLTLMDLKHKYTCIGTTLLIIVLYATTLFAGNITLAWNPPTTNTEGTPLIDLAGYKIYYGNAPGNYSNNIDVGNATTYTVSNLTDGLTYYFAVIAYDTSKNESVYSNEVSTTINPPPPPAPQIAVTDSVVPADDLQIPFSNVQEGNSSNQTVTISNTGNANLVIGTIAQTNPLAAPFSILNDTCSGKSIIPSATCTFTVRFSPTAAGSFNDTFDIPSNDSAKNPVTISVSGTGLVNSPPAANAGGPYADVEGQAVTLNGSASSDSDGSIVLYEWDINNDGTYDYSSSSPTQSHTYTQQGTYTVKLRVTDNLGKTNGATTTATVTDTSPTANFTGVPTSGTAPLTVSFTNNSTGYDQPLTYAWDFDNNGTTDSTVKNPSYTYANPGTYTVKLTVTDSDGSIKTLTKTSYITVTSPTYTLTVNVTGSGTVTSSPAGINCPGDCSAQYSSGNVVTLTATPEPGYKIASWTGCNSISGNQCTITMNGNTTVTAAFSINEISLSCTDAGNIKCLERTDGGSDNDNLNGTMPSINLDFQFQITVKDTSGNAPQYIKLFMTQRNNPSDSDFYSYNMSCSGTYSTGALCNYITKLGSAAVHKFYFETKMADGTILRYPSTEYITGPKAQLLSGYNIVGIPRNIGNDVLDGATAFGSPLTYRWNADLGYYTQVTTTEPVRIGEGYFVSKEVNTLPELNFYGELMNTTFTYKLKPGWNLISTPYSGNVSLSAIKIQKGNNSPITWLEANTNNWLPNAIYYYNGEDWGSTYSFDIAPQAAIIPWIGYWIYLNMTDNTYYLVISKP